MGRFATIIGQCRDYAGRDWDIRESRPTNHGWPLVIGWPVDTPRGKGGGGVRVIPTQELVDYLRGHAFRPKEVDLPCGLSTIKRLRRLACLYWFADNPQWWTEHKDELLSSLLDNFCKKHNVSIGAASQWRKQFRGNMDLITTKEAATIIGVTVRRVQALIKAEKLPAERIGRDWMIRRADAEKHQPERGGRPKREADPQDI